MREVIKQWCNSESLLLLIHFDIEKYFCCFWILLSSKRRTWHNLNFLCFAEVFGRCFTPRQERGECIYFKSCGSLWQLFNKRPALPQDRLYISLSQCGFRDGQPLVCCTDAPAQQAPQPTQPPFQPVQPQPVNPGPAPPPNQIHSTLLPKPGDCGVDAENRIYGGNVTAIDEYPWMVLLQYSKRECFLLYHQIIMLNVESLQSKQQKRFSLRRCFD